MENIECILKMGRFGETLDQLVAIDDIHHKWECTIFHSFHQFLRSHHITSHITCCDQTTETEIVQCERLAIHFVQERE